MKNKQKGFVIPLIIAIVAILAIVGGVFYFYSSNITKVPSSIIQISSSTAGFSNQADSLIVNKSSCPEDVQMCSDGNYLLRKEPKCEFSTCPAINSQMVWKTYKNDKYGFYFSYPSEMIVDDKDSQNIYLFSDISGVHDVKYVINFTSIDSALPISSKDSVFFYDKIRKEVLSYESTLKKEESFSFKPSIIKNNWSGFDIGDVISIPNEKTGYIMSFQINVYPDSGKSNYYTDNRILNSIFTIYQTVSTSTCSCPSGYIQDGNTCNPKCYYSTPKCLIPSVLCTNVIKVCTADAMQCPDGSYVGRSGSDCEFVCPGWENSKTPIQY